MKIKSFLYLPLLAVLTLFTVSCSDDDDNITDPTGTIAINILNEDNGKTTIGNSDVYIDNAHNFYGPKCLISNLGKKNGLGSISEPVLNGLGSRIAVETGNAYQIFKRVAMHEFPSGNSALDINADYYNVYVTSQIKQNDEIVGANVKYALMNVPHNDLPEYNSRIGILDHRDIDKQEITLTLPDSDFELETAFASSNYYTLKYDISGNKLIVRLIGYKNSDVFGFYIRIKNSYTYVYGEVI